MIVSIVITWVEEKCVKNSWKEIEWGFHRHLEDLDFAYDICLISHKDSNMQSKINDLIARSKLIGLDVNIIKTKAMHSNTINNNELHIDNYKKQYIESFCYKSSIMSAQGGVEENVNINLRKARAAFGRLDKE